MTGCLRSLLPVLLALAWMPTPARAGETSHTCRGFIDSVPVTLTTQGVWCLRGDLATAIASGSAITVATNNVTIDCNGFKLGGLAAGAGTAARGISAWQQKNTVIRHCNIRGFAVGIELATSEAEPGASAGHLVVDNRLDNNTTIGIRVVGENTLVLRNLVYDTGGASGGDFGLGIVADGHVVDNTVSGVFANATNASAYGINHFGAGGQEIRGNRIRGLVRQGTGVAVGIYTDGEAMQVVDNLVAAPAAMTGTGLWNTGAGTTCRGNHVAWMSLPFTGCAASLDNTSL